MLVNVMLVIKMLVMLVILDFTSAGWCVEVGDSVASL